jgi:type I restriction enzyme, R subunit
MKELRLKGGDKIGRTIIFAANQNHAKFIVECFTKRYPQAPSGFIAMVHNQVSHAQSLIDSFCDPDEERLPQIAVSVDMMDTGIDAPRVLNLVFLKIVRSYAKFWQMIGRGTRLCPDVFGPNQPKTEFKIFDVCLNFDFFEVNKKGLDTVQSKPITQQIFECRLQLSTLLKDTGEADDLELAVALLDNLHNAISKLDKRRFQVDMNLRYVEEFEKRERWNNIDSDDFHVIEEHLSALPVPEAINEVARRFDLMMLKLQIANLLMDSKERGYQSNLVAIGEQLSKKYTIPAVAKSKVTIESIKDIDFFKKITQRRLEEIRVEIRELVQYLDSKKREPIYTDIEDSPVIVADGATLNDYGNASIYKKRVESYIRENKTNLTISKLTSNQPITKEELVALENILFDGSERGSKEDFIEAYGEQPLGVFIRKIIGLSEEAAREVFSKFIQSGNLRADQITFVNKIISYLTKNGTIERAMLFESPFTDTHDQGLTGVFEDDNAFKILSLVDRVNDNANVG